MKTLNHILVCVVAIALIAGCAAKPHKVTSNEATLMVKASIDGDAGEIKKLIATNPNPKLLAISSNKYGDSPLILALKNRRSQAAKALIGGGADVNFANQLGKRPLIIAAGCCDIETVRLLLEHGADVNSIDNDGVVPLSGAIERGSMAVVRLLLDHGADVNIRDKKISGSPLSWAVTFNRIEIAKLLLRHGAITNIRLSNNETPLIQAIQYSRVDMAKLLIENGANINDSDFDRYAPLHVVAFENLGDTDAKNVELAKLLVSHGADVNAKTKDGRMPLNIALEHLKLNLVTFFVTKGADIDIRYGHRDWNLVHWAVWHADPLLLTKLIARRANIRLRDKDGNTPLHLASKFGKRMILAKILIDHGVLVNVRNSEGKTPLHLAAENDNPDTVKLLIVRDADINLRDHEGRIASDYAWQELKNVIRATANSRHR